jgi:hypothetical protein
MTKPISSLDLDDALRDRINRIAEVRHQSLDAILRTAVQQYLEREEKSAHTENANKHPSGKPWPPRSPVGGIITPV